MLQTSIESEPVTMTGQSFGKTARGVAAYGLIVGLALTVLSPLFVFIPAALFYCGIRLGRRAAWASLAIGVLVAGALVLSKAQTPSAAAEINGFYASVTALVLSVAIPVLLVLPMVERGEPFGRVLTIATILGVAGLALTEIGLRGVAGFSAYADQLQRVKEMAGASMDDYRKAGMPPDVLRVFSQAWDILFYCLPGSLVFNIAIVFVLSLVLFSRMPAWRLRFKASAAANPYLFRNLALPDWLLFVFIAGGVTPLLQGLPRQIGANVLAAVAGLYLLQGLAIFRAFLAAASNGGALLLCMALGLLTLTGVAPLLLSMGGLFDSFFDFRHINRKDDSHEGHTD